MSFRRKLLTVGLALGSIATPILADSFKPVQAGDEHSNWYMTIGSGFEKVSESNLKSKETGYTDVNGNMKYDLGFSGNLGVGYDFGSWRVEGTYGYSSFTTESVKIMEGGVTVTAPLSTNLENHSLKVGGFYDINKEGNKFSPYLGARAGLVKTNLDGITASVDVSGTTVSVSTNDSDDTAFTYEFLGGLNVNVSDAVDVFIETGWVGVGDQTFDLGNNAKLDVDSTGAWKTQIGFRHRL
ncbi:outer membrane protein [Prochlorococcus marinus]|uniref:outer membrane protein n=1 Tax=Prochlorococcus marinus TaxID=1219 RepID=UPI0022B2FE06|nr:outer membrane beta-barrel protein [Prochlorococcus marinus]